MPDVRISAHNPKFENTHKNLPVRQVLAQAQVYTTSKHKTVTQHNYLCMNGW